MGENSEADESGGTAGRVPDVRVIQGGMGVAISGWRLARAVARRGQLGVVSGTALEAVHARRLADGDSGGHLRNAYAAFPEPALAKRVLTRWFQASGRADGEPYRSMPMFRLSSPRALRELTVIANFAEVWLAKAGHAGPVGINYLEKIQVPTPDALYGALLAGADAVLMGAGIPAALPSLLDDLAARRPVRYPVTVSGSGAEHGFGVDFDPSAVCSGPALTRPAFLAIVSSNTLASFLAKDSRTRPDGFVVEHHSAGGHNAPPRGTMNLDEAGEPIYGARDAVRFEPIVELGLPFWLAGGFASPERLAEAIDLGARGIQVGSAFALSTESGLEPRLRAAALDAARTGTATVLTNPRTSPSGYPFKVLDLPGTLSAPEIYRSRRRRCDVGLLRSAYLRKDGSVGWRCASEPTGDFEHKGGEAAETDGRVCLCNALLATAGYPQLRDEGLEPPIVTIGDDIGRIAQTLGSNGEWSAATVLDYLLG